MSTVQSNDETPFSNAVIGPDAIPEHARVAFEPMAPNFRRYALVSTTLQLVPLVGVAVLLWLLPVVALDKELIAIAAGLLVLYVLTAAYRWLDAGRRGWVLREHDLIARTGVWWRTQTALPIARIQHVETTHGPLERSHGLARLKLYTAGGMTADLVLIGLPRRAADQLREHLIEQIRMRDSEAARTGDE